MQHHQAVQRADELHLAVAPAHQLGDRQFFQRRFEQRRQYRVDAFAGFAQAGDEIRRLASADFFQLGERDAGAAHEAFQRLGRLAVGVQPGAHRRAFFLQRALGLQRQAVRKQHRQPARRGEPFAQVVGGDEAGLGQRLLQRGVQGAAQSRQRFGRQFLAQQFDQQRRVHG